MNKRHPLMRTVASAVIFTFFFTNLQINPQAFAATGVPTNEVSSLASSMLAIPAELGQVTDSVIGDPSAPAFIHIQSAHGNFEAEKNIEKLLGYIEQNSSVKLMLLEGAAGKLNPGLFRMFPKHPDFNRKVTDRLMQEGFLTGPEVFLIEGDQKNGDSYLGTRTSTKRGTKTSPESRVPSPASSMQAFGIEDLSSYKQDREAFIKVVKQEKTAEKFLGSLRSTIDRRFSQKMNKDLLNLVRQEEAFGSGTLSFEGWLKALGEGSRQHLKVDLSDAFYQDQYPHLIRYYRLQAIASKIDEQKALAEKDLFLKELKTRKVPADVVQLITRGLGTRDSGLDKTRNQNESRGASNESRRVSGYSPLRAALESAFAKLPRDFSMKQWPNWTLYAQNIILTQELEAKGLQDETVRLKDKIQNTLAKKAEEKAYLAQARKLYLLRRLFSLELTRVEYEELNSHRDSYLVPRDSKVRATKTSDESRVPSPRAEALFASAMQFYSTAVTRENHMFDNALKKMSDAKEQRAVIVTGGFHAEGLKTLAAAKNASYIQISPRISEVTRKDREVYLRSVLGTKENQGLGTRSSGLDKANDPIERRTTNDATGVSENQAQVSKNESRVPSPESRILENESRVPSPESLVLDASQMTAFLQTSDHLGAVIGDAATKETTKNIYNLTDGMISVEMVGLQPALRAELRNAPLFSTIIAPAVPQTVALPTPAIAPVTSRTEVVTTESPDRSESRKQDLFDELASMTGIRPALPRNMLFLSLVLGFAAHALIFAPWIAPTTALASMAVGFLSFATTMIIYALGGLWMNAEMGRDRLGRMLPKVEVELSGWTVSIAGRTLVAPSVVELCQQLQALADGIPVFAKFTFGEEGSWIDIELAGKKPQAVDAADAENLAKALRPFSFELYNAQARSEARGVEGMAKYLSGEGYARITIRMNAERLAQPSSDVVKTLANLLKTALTSEGYDLDDMSPDSPAGRMAAAAFLSNVADLMPEFSSAKGRGTTEARNPQLPAQMRLTSSLLTKLGISYYDPKAAPQRPSGDQPNRSEARYFIEGITGQEDDRQLNAIIAKHQAEIMAEVEGLVRGYLDGETKKTVFSEFPAARLEKVLSGVKLWLSNPVIDRYTKRGLLKAIADKRGKDIDTAYYDSVVFGTAGVRGPAALSLADLEQLEEKGFHAEVLKGPNTVNNVTMAQVTEGVIRYYKSVGKDRVSITYDSRVFGKGYADYVAAMFLKSGFKVFLFDTTAPMPEMAYSVANLKNDLGILISASHNPPESQGYKVSNGVGAQLDPDSRKGSMAYIYGDAKAGIKGVSFEDVAEILHAAAELPNPVAIYDLPVGQFGPLVEYYAALQPKDHLVVLTDNDLAKDENGRQHIDIHNRHAAHVKSHILQPKMMAAGAANVHRVHSAFYGNSVAADQRILVDGLGFTNTTRVIEYDYLTDGRKNKKSLFPRFTYRDVDGQRNSIIPDPGDSAGQALAWEHVIQDLIAEEQARVPGSNQLDAIVRALGSFDTADGNDPDSDRYGWVVKLLEKEVPEGLEELPPLSTKMIKRIGELPPDQQARVAQLICYLVPKELRSKLGFGAMRLVPANAIWTMITLYRIGQLLDMEKGQHPDFRIPEGLKFTIIKTHVTTDALSRLADFGKTRGMDIEIMEPYVGFSLVAELIQKGWEYGKINISGQEESGGFSIGGAPTIFYALMHLYQKHAGLEVKIDDNNKIRTNLDQPDPLLMLDTDSYYGYSAKEIQEALTFLDEQGILTPTDSGTYKLSASYAGARANHEAYWGTLAANQAKLPLRKLAELTPGDRLGKRGHTLEKDGLLASVLTNEVVTEAKRLGLTPYEFLKNKVFLDPQIGYYSTTNQAWELPLGAAGNRMKTEILQAALELARKVMNGETIVINGKRVVKVKIFIPEKQKYTNATDFPADAYRDLIPLIHDQALRNDPSLIKSFFPEEGVRFYVEDETETDSNHLTIRPSGTEAKIRFYVQMRPATVNAEDLPKKMLEADLASVRLALGTQDLIGSIVSGVSLKKGESVALPNGARMEVEHITARDIGIIDEESAHAWVKVTQGDEVILNAQVKMGGAAITDPRLPGVEIRLRSVDTADPDAFVANLSISPAKRSENREELTKATVRVFLLEDSGSDARLIRETLMQKGVLPANFRKAESVADARKKLADFEPHVVILDQNVVGSEKGLILLAEIRAGKYGETAKQAFVIYTSVSDYADAQRAGVDTTVNFKVDAARWFDSFFKDVQKRFRSESRLKLVMKKGSTFSLENAQAFFNFIKQQPGYNATYSDGIISLKKTTDWPEAYFKSMMDRFVRVVIDDHASAVKIDPAKNTISWTRVKHRTAGTYQNPTDTTFDYVLNLEQGTLTLRRSYEGRVKSEEVYSLSGAALTPVDLHDRTKLILSLQTTDDRLKSLLKTEPWKFSASILVKYANDEGPADDYFSDPAFAVVLENMAKPAERSETRDLGKLGLRDFIDALRTSDPARLARNSALWLLGIIFPVDQGGAANFGGLPFTDESLDALAQRSVLAGAAEHTDAILVHPAKQFGRIRTADSAFVSFDRLLADQKAGTYNAGDYGQEIVMAPAIAKLAAEGKTFAIGNEHSSNPNGSKEKPFVKDLVAAKNDLLLSDFVKIGVSLKDLVRAFPQLKVIKLGLYWDHQQPKAVKADMLDTFERLVREAKDAGISAAPENLSPKQFNRKDGARVSSSLKQADFASNAEWDAYLAELTEWQTKNTQEFVEAMQERGIDADIIKASAPISLAKFSDGITDVMPEAVRLANVERFAKASYRPVMWLSAGAPDLPATTREIGRLNAILVSQGKSPIPHIGFFPGRAVFLPVLKKIYRDIVNEARSGNYSLIRPTDVESVFDQKVTFRKSAELDARLYDLIITRMQAVSGTTFEALRSAHDQAMKPWWEYARFKSNPATVSPRRATSEDLEAMSSDEILRAETADALASFQAWAAANASTHQGRVHLYEPDTGIQTLRTIGVDELQNQIGTNYTFSLDGHVISIQAAMTKFIGTTPGHLLKVWSGEPMTSAHVSYPRKDVLVGILRGTVTLTRDGRFMKVQHLYAHRDPSDQGSLLLSRSEGRTPVVDAEITHTKVRVLSVRAQMKRPLKNAGPIADAEIVDEAETTSAKVRGSSVRDQVMRRHPLKSAGKIVDAVILTVRSETRNLLFLMASGSIVGVSLLGYLGFLSTPISSGIMIAIGLGYVGYLAVGLLRYYFSSSSSTMPYDEFASRVNAGEIPRGTRIDIELKPEVSPWWHSAENGVVANAEFDGLGTDGRVFYYPQGAMPEANPDLLLPSAIASITVRSEKRTRAEINTDISATEGKMRTREAAQQESARVWRLMRAKNPNQAMSGNGHDFELDHLRQKLEKLQGELSDLPYERSESRNWKQDISRSVTASVVSWTIVAVVTGALFLLAPAPAAVLITLILLRVASYEQPFRSALLEPYYFPLWQTRIPVQGLPQEQSTGRITLDGYWVRRADGEPVRGLNSIAGIEVLVSDLLGARFRTETAEFELLAFEDGRETTLVQTAVFEPTWLNRFLSQFFTSSAPEVKAPTEKKTKAAAKSAKKSPITLNAVVTGADHLLQTDPKGPGLDSKLLNSIRRDIGQSSKNPSRLKDTSLRHILSGMLGWYAAKKSLAVIPAEWSAEIQRADAADAGFMNAHLQALLVAQNHDAGLRSELRGFLTSADTDGLLGYFATDADLLAETAGVLGDAEMRAVLTAKSMKPELIAAAQQIVERYKTTTIGENEFLAPRERTALRDFLVAVWVAHRSESRRRPDGTIDFNAPEPGRDRNGAFILNPPSYPGHRDSKGSFVVNGTRPRGLENGDSERSTSPKSAAQGDDRSEARKPAMMNINGQDVRAMLARGILKSMQKDLVLKNGKTIARDGAGRPVTGSQEIGLANVTKLAQNSDNSRPVNQLRLALVQALRTRFPGARITSRSPAQSVVGILPEFSIGWNTNGEKTTGRVANSTDILGYAQAWLSGKLDEANQVLAANRQSRSESRKRNGWVETQPARSVPGPKLEALVSDGISTILLRMAAKIASGNPETFENRVNDWSYARFKSRLLNTVQPIAMKSPADAAIAVKLITQAVTLEQVDLVADGDNLGRSGWYVYAVNTAKAAELMANPAKLSAKIAAWKKQSQTQKVKQTLKDIVALAAELGISNPGSLSATQLSARLAKSVKAYLDQHHLRSEIRQPAALQGLNLAVLKGKTIFVTGGKGYIAGAVTRKLLDAGAIVRAFDNLEKNNSDLPDDPNVQFIKGDIRNLKELTAAMAGSDAVVHLGAYIEAGVSVHKPALFWKNNVIGTTNVLDAMLANNLNKLAFASSAGVYSGKGLQGEDLLTEEVYPDPQNPYGETKLMMEKLMADYGKLGIRFVALRFFNAAGALNWKGKWHGEDHRPETHLLPLLMFAAMKVINIISLFGQGLKETPDGTPIRDYIHIEDLATAHLQTLAYLFNGGESQIMNLGTGKGTSVQEAVSVVEDVTSLTIPTKKEPTREGDAPILRAGHALATAILGWQPIHDFLSIVKTAWQYHSQVQPREKQVVDFSKPDTASESEDLSYVLNSLRANPRVSDGVKFENLFRLYVDSQDRQGTFYKQARELLSQPGDVRERVSQDSAFLRLWMQLNAEHVSVPDAKQMALNMMSAYLWSLLIPPGTTSSESSPVTVRSENRDVQAMADMLWAEYKGDRNFLENALTDSEDLAALIKNAPAIAAAITSALADDAEIDASQWYEDNSLDLLSNITARAETREVEAVADLLWAEFNGDINFLETYLIEDFSALESNAPVIATVITETLAFRDTEIDAAEWYAENRLDLLANLTDRSETREVEAVADLLWAEFNGDIDFLETYLTGNEDLTDLESNAPVIANVITETLAFRDTEIDAFEWYEENRLDLLANLTDRSETREVEAVADLLWAEFNGDIDFLETYLTANEDFTALDRNAPVIANVITETLAFQDTELDAAEWYEANRLDLLANLTDRSESRITFSSVMTSLGAFAGAAFGLLLAISEKMEAIPAFAGILTFVFYGGTFSYIGAFLAVEAFKAITHRSETRSVSMSGEAMLKLLRDSFINEVATKFDDFVFDTKIILADGTLARFTVGKTEQGRSFIAAPESPAAQSILANPAAKIDVEDILIEYRCDRSNGGAIGNDLLQSFLDAFPGEFNSMGPVRMSERNNRQVFLKRYQLSLHVRSENRNDTAVVTQAMGDLRNARALVVAINPQTPITEKKSHEAMGTIETVMTDAGLQGETWNHMRSALGRLAQLPRSENRIKDALMGQHDTVVANGVASLHGNDLRAGISIRPDAKGPVYRFQTYGQEGHEKLAVYDEARNVLMLKEIFFPLSRGRMHLVKNDRNEWELHTLDGYDHFGFNLESARQNATNHLDDDALLRVLDAPYSTGTPNGTIMRSRGFLGAYPNAAITRLQNGYQIRYSGYANYVAPDAALVRQIMGSNFPAYTVEGFRPANYSADPTFQNYVWVITITRSETRNAFKPGETYVIAGNDPDEAVVYGRARFAFLNKLSTIKRPTENNVPVRISFMNGSADQEILLKYAEGPGRYFHAIRPTLVGRTLDANGAMTSAWETIDLEEVRAITVLAPATKVAVRSEARRVPYLLEKFGLGQAAMKKMLALSKEKQKSEFDRILKIGNAKQGNGAAFAKSQEPVPATIPAKATKAQKIAYLKSVAAGEIGWADFAAGAASRLQVGPEYDPIGLVGLSRGILEKFPRDEKVKPTPEDFKDLITRAAAGKVETLSDLTFLQLQMLSLNRELDQLVEETPEAGVSLDQVLAGVRFVAIANDDNDDAFRAQMSAIRGAGFGKVYQITQNKEGVEKVLEDGTTVPTDALKVPEGHLVPLLDIAKRKGGSWAMNASGVFEEVPSTLKDALKKSGVKKLVFAQGNDLFLLNDFAGVERVTTANRVMKATGAKMIMELVENKIMVNGKATKQKGGGTVRNPETGFTWMRDTIGIGDIYPNSLSRMFYVIDIEALGKINEDRAPEYLNLKTLPDGSWAFSREMYSGDASSIIPGMTMQKKGHKIDTFKMRPRTDEALVYIDRLLNTPGFSRVLAQYAPAVNTRVRKMGTAPDVRLAISETHELVFRGTVQLGMPEGAMVELRIKSKKPLPIMKEYPGYSVTYEVLVGGWWEGDPLKSVGTLSIDYTFMNSGSLVYKGSLKDINLASDNVALRQRLGDFAQTATLMASPIARRSEKRSVDLVAADTWLPERFELPGKGSAINGIGTKLRVAIAVAAGFSPIFATEVTTLEAWARVIKPEYFPSHYEASAVFMRGVAVPAAMDVLKQIQVTGNGDAIVVTPDVVKMGLLPVLRAIYQSSDIFVVGADAALQAKVLNMEQAMSALSLKSDVEFVSDAASLPSALAAKSVKRGVSALNVSGLYAYTDSAVLAQALKEQAPDAFILVTSGVLNQYRRFMNDVIKDLMAEFQATVSRERSA